MKDARVVVADYAERILEGLAFNEVYGMAFEATVDRLESYSDDELLAEITEYASDLLED